MIVPVRYNIQSNAYVMCIDLNNTPAGFEDNLDGSTFSNLLRRNQAYVELTQPVIDAHVDPRVSLKRQMEIHPSRVCGALRLIEASGDKIYYALTPVVSKHGNVIQQLDVQKKLFLQPRLIYNGDIELIDIITFDVVEVN